jgi:hypothetical protein
VGSGHGRTVRIRDGRDETMRGAVLASPATLGPGVLRASSLVIAQRTHPQEHKRG